MAENPPGRRVTGGKRLGGWPRCLLQRVKSYLVRVCTRGHARARGLCAVSPRAGARFELFREASRTLLPPENGGGRQRRRRACDGSMGCSCDSCALFLERNDEEGGGQEVGVGEQQSSGVEAGRRWVS